MASAPLLHVNNLSISFQQHTQTVAAVQDVSFSLNAGETLALVGESGSGKSVTALSLVRLIPSPPAKYPQGQLIYQQKNGETVDLLTLNETAMQNIRGKEIACIFQEPMSSLNPLMRCGDQVIEMIRQHTPISYKEARTKALHLFEEVQLPTPNNMLDRYPHELSGGQKQRVMIAMAIACEPRLLIADEPTTALDVSMQAVIIDLLKTLQEKYGMAILFISHDLNVVAKLAHHIAVLYKGQLVEHGQATTLLQAPQHPYTQGLLACRPTRAMRVKQLPTLNDFLNDNQTDSPPQIITPNVYQERLTHLAQQPCLLEFKQVSLTYQQPRNWFNKKTPVVHAVKEVSFHLHQGATLGLLGESGSGKSSMGKALVLLHPISAGEITYRGQSIHGLRGDALKQYRREVQLIFQDPYAALNPRMRIGAAIEEPMHVHKLHPSNQRREKVIELLELVGLSADHYKRYPHEFSGGQRQRITIARALALEPKLLVCDESVSALDVSVQAQVLNLLVDLRDKLHLTYLFISHDVAVVKHISDYIAVMQQGQLVEYNDAEGLFLHPKHAFTQGLLQVEASA